MTKLLEIREKLRNLYSKNGRFVMSASKMLLMLSVLYAIQSVLNVQGLAGSFAIILMISLICSISPNAVNLTFLLAYTGVALYSACMEGMIVYVTLCMIFIVSFFIFKPGKSYVFTISVLLGLFSCYGPLPMILGLIFTPISCIPMMFGIITSFLLRYISENAVAFAQAETTSFTQKILQILKGVFLDENLLVTLFLAVGVALLIYFIRRLSLKHNWGIAITTGCISTLLLTIIFNMVLDSQGDYLLLAVNAVLEAITGVVLMFFFFMVDYSREQLLQFEDDEYYYYVKAVPKLTLSKPDMKVTRIRESSIKEIKRNSSQVTFIRNKEDTMEGREDTNQMKLPPPIDNITDKEED